MIKHKKLFLICDYDQNLADQNGDLLTKKGWIIEKKTKNIEFSWI